MIDDLLIWLRVQLDEDERWALAASSPYRYAEDDPRVPADGVHWTWVVGENWTPVTPDPLLDEIVGGDEQAGCSVNLVSKEHWPAGYRPMPAPVANQMVEVYSGPAGHIVRHDPARVLLDVEATRRILDRLDEVLRYASHHTTVESCDEDGAILAEAVLRLLAAPYADRDGYRPGWAPQ